MHAYMRMYVCVHIHTHIEDRCNPMKGKKKEKIGREISIGCFDLISNDSGKLICKPILPVRIGYDSLFVGNRFISPTY